jgi:hypothetical protein
MSQVELSVLWPIYRRHNLSCYVISQYFTPPVARHLDVLSRPPGNQATNIWRTSNAGKYVMLNSDRVKLP